jgi:spoIIIJ-associated protein
MEEIRNTLPAEVVKEIVGYFDLNARITSWEDEDEIHVDVWGDDVAILIGKGGRTLEALHEITSTITRRQGDEPRRVMVDVEKYRERKRKRLVEISMNAADRAWRQQRPISLDAMSASERKTVHDALKDDDRVNTQSDGDDPDRRVTIYPVD